jgi:predicted nucleic acid-binding protein
MKTRIFADTNILIAGADSRSGASRAVLLMGEIGLYTLVVSRQVLDEAERNIRAKFPRALPNFAEQMSYLTWKYFRNQPLQNPPSGKLSSKQKMHPF